MPVLADAGATSGSRLYVGGSDWWELRQGCWRRLWLDKTRSRPQEPTGAMVRGLRLEGAVAEEYSQRTGRSVRCESRLLRRGASGSDRWFAAHIDRWAVDSSRPHGSRLGVLEIKTVNPWRWRTIQREGLPECWLDQVQWYLFVTRRPWADLVVCEPLEWQIDIRPIEPDAARMQELLRIGNEFAGLLMGDAAPGPLPSSDQRCRRCRWWSECHPQDLGEPEPLDGEVERDDALEDLARADMEARAILREAQEHADRVREQLREALAGRKRVDSGIYRIEVRTVKRKSYTVPESTFEQIVIKEAR